MNFQKLLFIFHLFLYLILCLQYEDGDKEKDAEIQNGHIVEENEKVTNGYSKTVSNGTSYELPSTKL